jgi:Flp pilus assembly secretin CpaC
VQVRELNTDCELELGKTAVISGLLQQHVDHKHPGNQPDEVETLFLITPELVDAASPLEQPKSAEAPKPVPAPTAWAPAATRRQ